MTTNTTPNAMPSRALFPSRAKILVGVLVASLLIVALYLIAVRADALMLDLAKIGQALCL